MSSRPQQLGIAAVSTSLSVEHRVLATSLPVESLSGEAILHRLLPDRGF